MREKAVIPLLFVCSLGREMPQPVLYNTILGLCYILNRPNNWKDRPAMTQAAEFYFLSELLHFCTKCD